MPWSTLCRADWVRNDPVPRGWLLRHYDPVSPGAARGHEGLSALFWRMPSYSGAPRSHREPPVAAAAGSKGGRGNHGRGRAAADARRGARGRILPPLSLGFLVAIVVVIGPAALASLGVEPLDPLAICSFRYRIGKRIISVEQVAGAVPGRQTRRHRRREWHRRRRDISREVHPAAPRP